MSNNEKSTGRNLRHKTEETEKQNTEEEECSRLDAH